MKHARLTAELFELSCLNVEYMHGFMLSIARYRLKNAQVHVVHVTEFGTDLLKY